MNWRGRDFLTLAAAGCGIGLAAHFARKRSELDLRGKVVLITGGSRGLGLVIAREMARAGARVAICGRDPGTLERAFEDLAARGAHVLALPCDVTDRYQVAKMVQIVTQRWGGIDVLVNNAGTIEVGPAETMTLSDFEEAMQTNYWAAVYTCLAVLPGMLRRRAGSIVNITSIGGKVSVPHLLPYSSSKFALVGFSEGLRAELSGKGVTVTTVVPGLMRTGSPRNADFKGQHEAEYTWFALSDTLPGISISAESAARRIVRACRRGEAEVILSLPAKAAVLLHGLFPGLTSDLLGLVNRWLPEPGGIYFDRMKGKVSETPLTRSWLTALGRKAAEDNNEVAPEERVADVEHLAAL